MTTNRFVIDAFSGRLESIVSIVNISAWGDLSKPKYVKFATWNESRVNEGQYDCTLHVTNERDLALRAIDILPSNKELEKIKDIFFYVSEETKYETNWLRHIGVLVASEKEITILNKL